MAMQNVLLVAGAASFSTRDVWEGYQAAMRDAGIAVVPYPTFSMLRLISPELIGNDIIGKALDCRNRIDAVVFVDGLYFQGRRGWVPRTIKDAGLPTVLIATDDPYEPVEGAAENYSHRFTNEIECASAGVGYLPTAASIPPPGDVGRIFDLAFIGTVFEDRLPLLRQVAEHCESQRIRFLIAGNMSDGLVDFERSDCVTIRREVIPSELKWRLYRGAKVVLNLFRHAEYPAQSPNPRMFEVTALGGPALLSGPSRREAVSIFGDSIFHFDDLESLQASLTRALGDEDHRERCVRRARDITLADHLYANRVVSLQRQLADQAVSAGGSEFPIEDRLCWIFGCGRTGSTWLGQMLGRVPGIHSWHEPMFGKLFSFVEAKPDEQGRVQSFYASQTAEVWLQAMRETFLRMARRQFRQANPGDALVVKEVNAAECCPYLRQLFPASRMIFLARDPYDVLDSFLDMQRPGGWNETYGGGRNSLEERAELACRNIARSFRLSLQAYEAFPEPQRRFLRYEELLASTEDSILNCANLVGVPLTPCDARKIATELNFERQGGSGRLKHRRYGKAGVWQDSENFTAAVRKIADSELGGIRKRLEYAM